MKIKNNKKICNGFRISFLILGISIGLLYTPKAMAINFNIFRRASKETTIEDKIELYKSRILKNLQVKDREDLFNAIEEMKKELNDEQKSQVFSHVFKSNELVSEESFNEILSVNKEETSLIIATAITSVPEKAEDFISKVIEVVPERTEEVVTTVADYDSQALANVQDKILKKEIKVSQETTDKLVKAVEDVIKKNPEKFESLRQATCKTVSNSEVCQ